VALLTELQYRILKKIAPGGSKHCDGSYYAGKSKLEVLLGKDLLGRIAGKTVIDFGCGEGAEAIELARKGARKVVGLDIDEARLEVARRRAAAAGVEDKCSFVSATREPADVVVSLDAFEHFDDPARILEAMSSLLRPEGEVIACFGPTWYHPLGGHMFSVFPWAHLLFSERALIRWRSDFKSDGATRFREVAGGLNRMTVRRFEQLVRRSPLRLVELKTPAIRGCDWLNNRLTREFVSARVNCRLAKRTPM
jgi:SAM-dependent methyltransferase